MESESAENQGIKLTEQELKLLTDLDSKKTAVNRELAFLSQQQVAIDVRKEDATNAYRQNLDLEKQIASSLTEKYGNGTIDIKSGMFIPS